MPHANPRPPGTVVAVVAGCDNYYIGEDRWVVGFKLHPNRVVGGPVHVSSELHLIFDADRTDKFHETSDVCPVFIRTKIIPLFADAAAS